MNLKTPFKIPLYIVSAIFLVFVTICAFAIFEKSVNKNVFENSTDFLKETAFLYAGTFQVKLNDQLFMLESQARYFNDIDMNDYNLLKKTIMSTKGMGEFKRIAVANSSGMTINSDGKSSGNILMKDYFKKAMEGHAQISSTISTDEDGEKVLTLAVPILKNGSAVGVITGTFSYSVLENIFSVDTFGGEGYSVISDKNGFILIGTVSSKRLCTSDNWFEFLVEKKALSKTMHDSIYDEMQKDNTGIFNFSLGEESRLVVYTPVGRNGWYVISAITSDYIFSQQAEITQITVKLVFMVTVVFVIIMIFFCRMMILRIRLEKDNSRYAINYETSQSVIFDYDFEKKIIEFTGNTAFFFGINLKSIPLSEFGRIEERIHEAEKGLLLKIQDFLNDGGTRFVSEVRLLCKNNEYVWYRITGNLILDKENIPIKFIGNAVNVNAQVIHEQELKTMAEMDGLSGLLNKVYMEKFVSNFIAETKESNFAAFFIIDLDNFKQVNDKLGHSYGDQAICDTANKLNLVFSERDFIGRIGGDEFCVLLCVKSTVKNPMQIVLKKAQTLREILSEDYTNGETLVHVTASVGISLFPNQAKNYMSLFRLADTALYHVKNNGKNSFAIYDDKMKDLGESVYE